MSDHEFEKRVHHKMDELRLRPSDAVWAEVERNLRREKRRRRTLLWLPLMGLLLTVGGYMIFSGNGEKEEGVLAKSQTEKAAATTQSQSQSESKENTATPKLEKQSAETPLMESPAAPSTTPNEIASTPKTTSNQKINQPVLDNSTPSTQQRQQPNIDQPAKNNISKNNNLANKEPIAKSKRASKETSQPDAIAKQKKVALKNQADQDPVVDKTIETIDAGIQPPATTTAIDSAAKTISKSDSETKKTDSDSKKTGSESKKIDSATKKIDSAAKKAVAPPAIVQAPKKKKQSSSSSKIQFGVIANASVANVSEGSLFGAIFGGEAMKSVRVQDLTDQSPSYNGIPPVPTPEPSPIRPGAAFTVGGFAQTNSSKRLSVSVGLQYSLFTVNTTVGKRVDSSLAVNYGTTNSQLTGSYYRADNMMHDYTNRYHFIEIPIMAHLRLTGKKIPVVLDAGVSISRLINTNALHYDGLSRVYYENDDFFDKSQFSLNTGLSVGLWQKSKHPVWIGPNLRYFTTTLLKKEVSASSDEHRVWSFGLNAKMLLKK